MFEIAGEQQIDEHDAYRKHHTNQSLGQQAQRRDQGKSPAGEARRPAALPGFIERTQKEKHAQREPQPDDQIGNKKPREQIDAKRGEDDQPSVEAGLFAVNRSAEVKQEQRER